MIKAMAMSCRAWRAIQPWVTCSPRLVASGRSSRSANGTITSAKAIVAQDWVPVLEGDTEAPLAERVLQVEHRLYPRALRLVAEGRATLLAPEQP